MTQLEWWRYKWAYCVKWSGFLHHLFWSQLHSHYWSRSRECWGCRPVHLHLRRAGTGTVKMQDLHIKWGIIVFNVIAIPHWTLNLHHVHVTSRRHIQGYALTGVGRHYRTVWRCQQGWSLVGTTVHLHPCTHSRMENRQQSSCTCVLLEIFPRASLTIYIFPKHIVPQLFYLALLTISFCLPVILEMRSMPLRHRNALLSISLQRLSSLRNTSLYLVYWYLTIMEIGWG